MSRAAGAARRRERWRLVAHVGPRADGRTSIRYPSVPQVAADLAAVIDYPVSPVFAPVQVVAEVLRGDLRVAPTPAASATP